MKRWWLFLTAILVATLGCTGGSYKSGDRVLVAKFPYDSGLTAPERFDVVVFKYPAGPVKKGVPTNYIKRLLGLPGEIIAIFFGRLWRLPAPGPGMPPYFDDSLVAKINAKTAEGEIDVNNLWQLAHTHMSETRIPTTKMSQFRQQFHAGKFDIIRKPPEVVLAMRRLVYDNDFQAKDLAGEAWQRWQPNKESAWSDDQQRGFHFSAGKKETVDWLRYQHLVRPSSGQPLAAKAQPTLITDFMSYNNIATVPRDPNFNAHPSFQKLDLHWVGDLMLETNVTVRQPKGEFWLELSKGINRFRAKWDLATGVCTLYQEGPNQKVTELDKQPTRLKAPGTYQVRFANIDGRLTVWVDHDLPFEDGKAYPPPEVVGPEDEPITRGAQAFIQAGSWNMPFLALIPAVEEGVSLNLARVVAQNRCGHRENDLEPASIGAKDADLQIQHVRLWRDPYYTKNAGGRDQIGDHANKDWEPTMIYVQPGHYLCLGDNSPQSSDSRSWGSVPERLLLGRALLVYFPFERAGMIK